ncbi:hypothetical protein J7M22_00625, partial [Candidatus Poribacteria bacterium]|nr:hypothetical protein [Candidatus Poribacteria bacterium]
NLGSIRVFEQIRDRLEREFPLNHLHHLSLSPSAFFKSFCEVLNLNERGGFGKIELAEGGNRRGRIWANLPLIPRVMGYPPIRSPKNVSKIMGALQNYRDLSEREVSIENAEIH